MPPIAESLDDDHQQQQQTRHLSQDGLAVRRPSRAFASPSSRLWKVPHNDPDAISPLLLGFSKDCDDFTLDQPPARRQHSTKHGKRLSGRPSIPKLRSPNMSPALGAQTSATEAVSRAVEETHSSKHGHQTHHSHHKVGDLLGQIAHWLHEEKHRRHHQRQKKQLKRILRKKSGTPLERRDSTASSQSSSSSSSGSTALLRLETILESSRRASETSLSSPAPGRSGHSASVKPSKPSSMRSAHRRHSMLQQASDTDAAEVDLHVPHADVVLDNSKTLSVPKRPSVVSIAPKQSGGGVASISASEDAWNTFKFEIVRLAHTLGLKGWRQINMERSKEIDVERLCGALTNAVYVVSPPHDMPTIQPGDESELSKSSRKSRPTKVLLRIYGPQVEHLIDRESELQILRRLGRKRIGPCLLGTFTNGRFEQYLHARALKPEDLRAPDTSKRIAKRMRELHDGIELLDKEREAGPFVWQNWNKWVDRCEEIVTFVDSLIVDRPSGDSTAKKYRKVGLVCGTRWPMFRATVERYRKELLSQYGGEGKLDDQLIFAHNDTQYGNILRVDPPGESPLLLPANEHKQLVVIDFEYANANPRGMEFANHFTEWCYDYNVDAAKSYRCNTNGYPREHEQDRFIRAYLEHQPEVVTASSASINTPRLGPMQRPRTSSSHHSRPPVVNSTGSALSTLSLGPEALGRRGSVASSIRSVPRTPILEDSTLTSEPESDCHPDAEWVESEIERLKEETRLWRIANSAQWTVWGIVQARVPEFYQGQEINGESNNTEANGDHDETKKHPHIPADRGTDELDEESKALAADLHDRRPERFDLEDDDGTEGIGDGEEDEEDEEFDYLRYARDRALFFWGDCLQLGIVDEEELPRDLVERVKLVPY